jgi:hypothetical protein
MMGHRAWGGKAALGNSSVVFAFFWSISSLLMGAPAPRVDGTTSTAGFSAPLLTSTPTITPSPTNHTPTLTPTPTPRPDLLAVSGILPPSGPAAGGTAVTITGANFAPGASASIGGAPATGVFVQDGGHISATVPALPAASLNDVVVPNPNLDSATLRKGWLADFLDVPQSNPFHGDVETAFRAAVTAGCGTGMYCPDAAVTRAQMAVLLLKAKYGGAYVPPMCSGIFADVSCPSLYANWIEFLYTYQISAGCGGNLYCPDVPVKREQTAPLLLKARHGYDYLPPACQGVFGDVACPGMFADWIERLAAEGITAGCGGGDFCPNSPVTRGQMAVFLAKSFFLLPVE